VKLLFDENLSTRLVTDLTADYQFAASPDEALLVI